MDKKLNILVAGGGSWGTALAHMLGEGGHKVVIYLRDENVCNAINEKHENPKYLAGLELNANVSASMEKEALLNKDIYLLAIPCQQVRTFITEHEYYFPQNAIIVNSAKGLEFPKATNVGQIIQDVLGHKNVEYATISGPSFAKEVLEGQPTAVVLACKNEEKGTYLREIFSNPSFRCYSSTDVIGVELGGALKNVIAIAAGVCDGLGFGHDPRAALLTRGLAEMSRLGVALGAEITTFMGLSGVGDLILTCTGNLSRNRQVGLRLGKGEELNAIVESLGMVSEGVKTTEAVYTRAKELNISLPITDAMYEILFMKKEPKEVVKDLMARKLREE